MNKMSERKLQLGNAHEMRFQYLDHNNPILSQNKRVSGYVSIGKSPERDL